MSNAKDVAKKLWGLTLGRQRGMSTPTFPRATSLDEVARDWLATQPQEPDDLPSLVELLQSIQNKAFERAAEECAAEGRARFTEMNAVGNAAADCMVRILALVSR